MTEPAADVPQSVWQMDSALTETAWFRDWDYYIASFTSLKQYLTEFGTFPLWNFHFCGGRPELANPQNWTLSWLHPFVYLMEPIYLILAVWLLMSLVGALAVGGLVKRWTGCSAAAAMAGAVYALSGYFGAHFNQGVLTFAFYHFVPLMIYLLDRRQESASKRNSVALFLVTIMFLTSALPHGLFYFYPALLLYVGTQLLLAPQSNGLRTAKGFWQWTYPHVLGVGASLYKLVPVIAWQRLFPREGVQTEFSSPVDILNNTLRVDYSYDNMYAQAFENQFWFLWEYNAYVGYAPWILAVLVGAWWLRSRNYVQRVAPSRSLVFGIILVVCGMLLAMGNGAWFAIGSYFEHFPLVKGIRVFGRYQVLLVFGLALLSGLAVALIKEKLGAEAKFRIFYMTIMLVTVGPLLTQVYFHVNNIRGVSFAELDERYGVPVLDQLQLVRMQGSFIKTGVTHHDYIVKKNGIVSNCYDPLTLDRPAISQFKDLTYVSLSDPPPEAINIGPQRMELVYNSEILAGPFEAVQLYLTNGSHPVQVSPELDRELPQGLRAVSKQQLVGSSIEVSASVPGQKWGLLGSVVSLGFFGWLWRRRGL